METTSYIHLSFLTLSLSSRLDYKNKNEKGQKNGGNRRVVEPLLEFQKRSTDPDGFK